MLFLMDATIVAKLLYRVVRVEVLGQVEVSGGGIYLESQNKAVITGTLGANGGNGGAGGQKGTGTSCNYSATFCGTEALISGNGSDGTTGGGGGGGRIKIFVPTCVQNTITPVNNVSGGTAGNSGLPGSYNVYLLCYQPV